MINNSNVKNLSIKKKIIAMGFAGTLATVSLVGCGNNDMLDTQYTFPKAVIFSDNSVTIVEVESWSDYDGSNSKLQHQKDFVS